MIKQFATNLQSPSHLHQLVLKTLGWIIGAGMVLIGTVMIIYGEWTGLSYLAFGAAILPVVDIPLAYRLAIVALGMVWLH